MPDYYIKRYLEGMPSNYTILATDGMFYAEPLIRAGAREVQTFPTIDEAKERINNMDIGMRYSIDLLIY